MNGAEPDDGEYAPGGPAYPGTAALGEAVIKYDDGRDTVAGVRELLAQVRADHREAVIDWRYANTLLEALDRLDLLYAERTDTLSCQRNAARARVRAVEMVHVWTNEDGKRFMFVDDVARALGLPGYMSDARATGDAAK